MTEFEKYIQRYLDLIPQKDWKLCLAEVGAKTLKIYSELSEQQGNFAYAEGKWTLKTLLEHLIDCESIFQYRALRFSRGDLSSLSGFDEKLFAQNGIAADLKISDLTRDFELTRSKSLLFFEKMPLSKLQLKGFANGNPIDAETIGKLIVGHNIHHLNIIEERYLPLLK